MKYLNEISAGVKRAVEKNELNFFSKVCTLSVLSRRARSQVAKCLMIYGIRRGAQKWNRRQRRTCNRDVRSESGNRRNGCSPRFLQMNETKKKKIISKNKINVPHRSGSSADHVTYKPIQINENVKKLWKLSARFKCVPQHLSSCERVLGLRNTSFPGFQSFSTQLERNWKSEWLVPAVSALLAFEISKWNIFFLEMWHLTFVKHKKMKDALTIRRNNKLSFPRKR